MKLTALSVIFSLFIVGLYAAATDLPPIKPTPGLPTPVDRKTTTTEAPTTTEASTTTEKSTTSTTTTSTTTPSPAPVTTPSTTEPPTSTTTEITTTTSTTSTGTPPTPTTTPGPEPGKPAVGKYVVTNGTNTCILLQFAAQLNVIYFDANNTKQNKIYNVPGTVGDKFKEVTGNCGNTTQSIHIEWSEGSENNTLELTFNFNATAKKVSLSKSVFNLSTNIVPSSQGRTILYYVGSTFEVQKDRSYHCTRAQQLNLTDTDHPTNATTIDGFVTVSDVLVEAFHTGDKQDFSTAIDCDAINTPDIVPIAVGIALIALVVIVLIAYLVGRRRAAARGYVSM